MATIYPKDQLESISCTVLTEPRTTTTSGKAWVQAHNIRTGQEIAMRPIFQNADWNSAPMFQHSVDQAVNYCMNLQSRNGCKCNLSNTAAPKQASKIEPGISDSKSKAVSSVSAPSREDGAPVQSRNAQ